MNRLPSHRIVRECSEYRCKGFRRVSGASATRPRYAEGGRPNLPNFTPDATCLETRERPLLFLNFAGLQQSQKVAPYSEHFTGGTK